MTADERIEQWLVEWQDCTEAGEPIDLDRLCRSAPELRPELERQIAVLLRFQQIAQPTADSSSRPDGDETLPNSSPASLDARVPRDAVPGYEIIDVIGRGGMGVVYRARQIALNRIVALKMILSGEHADDRDRTRFILEAESIARITHPNVIGVYDFGTHAGRPYFSMEYIEGGSLSRHITGEPQPPQEAARWLFTIASGVQAAHDAKIIHRDLKPDNVLLARTREGEIIPKVTDFGLARSGESNMTTSNAVMGTPNYMAPEQAAGNMREVDHHADVWALGVMLYEMLTGRVPFKGTSIVETLNMVQHADPVPPSRLQPQVPRDLETICLKCLQKDPQRRYSTAQALADDLQRFLRGDVILARPVSRFERAVRWCRKNPRDASLLTAFIVLLVAAFTGMTILWRGADRDRQIAQSREAEAKRLQQQADEQRDKAERNERAAKIAADQAKQASDFMAGVLEASDPLGLTGYGSIVPRYTGEQLTARELLNRALPRLQQAELTPESKAMLLERIGCSLVSLGDFQRAETLLVEALTLRRGFGPEAAQDVAASTYSLGWLYHTQGIYVEAEKFYRESLRLRETLGDERALASSCFSLAWLLAEMSEIDEARQLFERAVSIRERVLGKDHRDVALARLGVASVLLENGDYLKAIELSRQGMEILLGAEQNSDLAQAVGLFQQAVITDLGLRDPATAERLLVEADELVRKRLGDRHLYRALVLGQLSHAQWGIDAKDKAEKSLRDCLDIARAQVGLTHPRVAPAIDNLATALRKRGQNAEAERLYAEWISACRGSREHQTTFLADALVYYSDFKYHLKQEDQERELLEEAHKLFRAEPRLPRRRKYLDCLNYLGWNYVRHDRHTDAERIAREYVDAVVRVKGDRHDEMPKARLLLVRTLIDQNQVTAEVEQLLNDVRKVYRPLTPITSPHEDFPDLLMLQLRLAELRKDPVAITAATRECRRYAVKPVYLIDVAEVLVRCAERNPEGDHASEAVKLIAEAVQKGYKNAQYLRTAKTLAPLRNRPDYQQLLAKLK